MKLLLCVAALAGSGPVLQAQPAGWAPNLTSTAEWNSNVSNANRASDVIAALSLRTNVGVSQRFSPGRSATLVVGALVGAEAWPRFDGLDRTMAGLQAGWSHKFGLGAFAPVLTFKATGEAWQARESGRAGRAGSAALLLRQRLNEQWQLSLTYERARYDARQHAFDRTGQEGVVRVDYDLDERWRFSATARSRDGGVLSYATPPRPDLLKEGKALTIVTTFDRAAPMVAYYFMARTLTGELAVSRALGEAAALNFSYAYRETERGPITYVNHLVSLGVIRQF